MTVELLNPRAAADVEAVADLHTRYLGDSPIVALGRPFLCRFYYGKLLEERLIGCTVCRLDGQVVGFISYTLHPDDFMVRGLRRFFWYLCGMMLGTVIRKPSVLVAIWKTLRILRQRAAGTENRAGPGVGEGISVAVAPAHRDRRATEGGQRVPVALFESMIRFFDETRYQRFYVLVQPSNIASSTFCTAMGCRLENITVSGASVRRFVYDLESSHGSEQTG